MGKTTDKLLNSLDRFNESKENVEIQPPTKKKKTRIKKPESLEKYEDRNIAIMKRFAMQGVDVELALKIVGKPRQWLSQKIVRKDSINGNTTLEEYYNVNYAEAVVGLMEDLGTGKNVSATKERLSYSLQKNYDLQIKTKKAGVKGEKTNAKNNETLMNEL